VSFLLGSDLCDPAYDFIAGTTKIELKGPFLSPDTLRPISNPNIDAIADSINSRIRNVRGVYDQLVIDTLGAG
jgi:hypothetical protein